MSDTNTWCTSDWLLMIPLAECCCCIVGNLPNRYFIERSRVNQDDPSTQQNRKQWAHGYCVTERSWTCCGCTLAGEQQSICHPVSPPKGKRYAVPGFHWWCSNSRCHKFSPWTFIQSQPFSWAALSQQLLARADLFLPVPPSISLYSATDMNNEARG